MQSWRLTRAHDLPASGDRLVLEPVGLDAMVVNRSVIRRAGADVIVAGGALPVRVIPGSRSPSILGFTKIGRMLIISR